MEIQEVLLNPSPAGFSIRWFCFGSLDSVSNPGPQVLNCKGGSPGTIVGKNFFLLSNMLREHGCLGALWGKCVFALCMCAQVVSDSL